MPTGFLLITAAFLAFLAALYLLVAPRRTAVSVLLALGFAVCGAQNIFDFLCLSSPAELATWKTGTLVAEALLPVFFAWAGVLTGCRFRTISWLMRGLLVSQPLLLIPALVNAPNRLMRNPDFGDEQLLFLTQAGYLFYLALLVSLTFALVLQERSFARLKRLERWHLKFEYLGIGTILAVQVLYYSQGLLYRSLDMRLVTGRSLALILGLLLFAYSRYRRGYPEKLSISHDVAFRSVAVLVVGAYLIGLGLVGEGMRYFGAGFDRTLFMLLALCGGLALMVLVLSEQLRRKTAVWLHKHFFRQKYDYRAHWMEFTRRLGLAREPATLRLVILEFYCQTFGLRGGTLYLAGDDQGDYLPVAAYEKPLPTRNIERNGMLGQFLQERKWVFNRDDQAVADILSATPELFASAETHFVVPLFFNDRLEGLVALGAPINTGEAITYEDYDLMKALAAQAASVLHGQQLLHQLATSHEMVAIGKVSAFVMHDLKNAVTNLALVVDNAREYMDDPEFQRDMLETLGNSVERMRGLIGRLRDFEQNQQLDCALCDLYQLVESAVADFPEGSVSLAGDQVWANVDGGEISRVVLNLVLNALDAMAGEGPVKLLVGKEDLAVIRCIDQGEGMSADFIRERLFRPFETTKNKGFGIGLYQCQQIVNAHGGRIDVQSKVGLGTEFTVWLPRIQENEMGES
jgi:putative PEP-CTERM system histidine kinase